MTHVDQAGRPHSLYSRVCSCLAARFYYCCIIFSYVWAEPRLIMLLSKIMGGGIVMPRSSPQHDCDAMILAAAKAIFWPARVFGICSECQFVKTRFTCGNWGKFHIICPVFNLRVPPRVGANRRVCITAF